MTKNIQLLLTFACLITISACGGGSEDSSGAGSSADSGGTSQVVAITDESGGDDETPAARTYNGEANVVLTADGFPPISGGSPLKVVVDGSRITLTVDGKSVTTTLQGDSFSASIPISETDNGITCSGTAKLNGKVTDNTVSGDIGGDGTCTGAGVDTPVTLSGSFSTTR